MANFLRSGRITVDIVFHDLLNVSRFKNRKDLATYCESRILSGLNQKIKVNYISSEIKKIEDFSLFSKFKENCSFKVVEGHTVNLVYQNFLENSAGPFGNDIKGNWISYDNFYKLLEFKLKQNGWLDVHSSFIDPSENTLFKYKYFFLDRFSTFRLRYKKKLIRWKKKYIKRF